MQLSKIIFPVENSLDHVRYGHRCYTLATEGQIFYDPPRPKADPFWCIADIDKDITAYYRKLFEHQFHKKLYAPAFDAHVSILRGVHTPKMDATWKYLDNTPCVIHYDHRIWYNKQHVWLNVYFPEYFKIREFYELPDWNYSLFGHLTIGKFTA